MAPRTDSNSVPDYRLGSAAEAGAAVITRCGDGWRRDAGVYLARAATAHAHAGEVDQAATVALHALAIGSETGSGRALAELTDTDQALAGWAKTPTVRRFHDALITYGGRPHADR